MSTASADLEEQLRTVLETRVGHPLRIDEVDRLPGGSSRETWRFTAHSAGESRRYVLRRDPPGAPGSGMQREARLLQAAGACGVPVPEVVASGDAADGLDASFVVVEYVDGESIPRRILRDEQLAGARAVLASQCGEVLAAVHRIPAAAVGDLPDADPLAQLRDLSDQLGQPHPAFELALAWLDAHRPVAGARVVVHGDFRNGNLMVGPDGIRAVLDWELAHIGDPIEDLGWLCVKAWRFGSSLPVGGFGRREELVDAYQAASGRTVEPAALFWWEVFGTLRWGTICIVQTMTHLSGAVRSVELAAIGRRVAEVEWDLLEMLP